MACVSWMATEISANLEHIEEHERWYEHEETAAISYTRSRESLVHIPRVSYADINERHTDPWMEINLAVQEIHPSFEKEVERATRQCSTRRAVPPTSPSTSDQLQLNSQASADDRTYESYSDHGSPNSNEVDPQVTSKQNNKRSQQECYEDSLDCYEPAPTQWQLNTTLYFNRVAVLIKTKFFGERFTDKPTLAFRRRMDNAHRKEKDFWTKADPIIDTWMLIFGQVREVFHLETFVRAHPAIDKPLAELRRLVKRRVLHEDCPVVKINQVIAENKERRVLNIKRRTTRRREGQLR